MKATLRVLTLNCWGVPVPFVCKLRKQRMVAVGEEIAKSYYDIVILQEVWHKQDFKLLKSKVSDTLPHSHYFYSGSIGSGLCLFSKYPIVDMLYHKFDLNGYAHKVQHGDWFGGKGVGLAVVSINSFQVHLYVTHIHAEYNRLKDEYLAHRLAQAFSTSQFIKFTNTKADLTLLCGDLNLEPVDLGYKLIRSNANLEDAWLDKVHTTTADSDGNTCDCPGNSFCNKKTKIDYPNGKRIDYILYRAGLNTCAVIQDCSVVMGKVPGQIFNFSDHEGVEATIEIERQPNTGYLIKEMVLPTLAEESLEEINNGLARTKTNSRLFIVLAIICLMFAYLISVIHIPYPWDFLVTLFKLILVSIAGFGTIQTFVMIRSEVHGLEATRDSIKCLLRQRKDLT